MVRRVNALVGWSGMESGVKRIRHSRYAGLMHLNSGVDLS